MPPQEIEVILTRQLAGYLAMPVFIADTEGSIIYYNEPAESILGIRFDETGPLNRSVYPSMFSPVNPDGTPIPPDELPIHIAVHLRRPCHKRFLIHGADRTTRLIESTGFPLIGQEDRFLGAVVLFWEVTEGL